MVRRLIVIVPSLAESAAETIATFRRRFDPLADLVPPHITLVFPFESSLSPDELRAHAQGAVRGVAPFPLRLAGITGSERAYLFLKLSVVTMRSSSCTIACTREHCDRTAP